MPGCGNNITVAMLLLGWVGGHAVAFLLAPHAPDASGDDFTTPEFIYYIEFISTSYVGLWLCAGPACGLLLSLITAS
jgi:hypothetical protein